MAPRVERLEPNEHDLVRPLLLELYEYEQPFFSEHPQLSHSELEQTIQRIPTSFRGENVVLAVRAPQGLAGFCWCVLFDPGTGLEGEVAELYVAEGHRREGVGRALLGAAIKLFEERAVTLGYVWTRPENDAAVKLYQDTGFTPNRQLVLTWYPDTGSPS
ncbi:MAG: GNAT family N-acetyltransferase [Candidatus Dormibacteraeota bacterium]|nr:GNAT family N-acetyltransferase [Candidatus Dormibacteraeota bacterium]